MCSLGSPMLSDTFLCEFFLPEVQYQSEENAEQLLHLDNQQALGYTQSTKIAT